MTFSLPLSEITEIISSLNPIALPVSERIAFAAAINHVYYLTAVINAIAIAPSLLRGSRKAVQLEEASMSPRAHALEGE